MHRQIERQLARVCGELSILWFDWGPCNSLRDLTAEYPGDDVSVTCVPISEWYSTTFSEFEAGAGHDLVLLDSQWVGEAVESGHVVEISDWVNSEDFERFDFYVQALEAYGEYPPKSNRFFGIAMMGDVQMLVYRKDAFDARDEPEPVSMERMLELAQDFKASGEFEQGFASFWCGDGCYDETSTIFNQIAWSMGGSLWDPETYQIDGLLQSDANVRALEFTKALFEAGNGEANGGFGNMLSPICNGQAAMGNIWMGFGPTFTDPVGCPMADNLAFAPIPEMASTRRQILSLGGMGIHISKYSAQEAKARDLLSWLTSRSVQRTWAELGGLSPRKSVVSTADFIQATPYNLVFLLSYALTRDFWNLPIYEPMLAVHQSYLHEVLLGNLEPREALVQMAAEEQAIMDEAYPNGPPGSPTPQVTILDAGGLGTGVVVAIVLGSMAAIALIAGSIIYYQRGKAKDLVVKYEEAKGRADEAEQSVMIQPADLTVTTRIGEGSFGEVFVGQLHGTTVAVKRLRVGTGLDKKQLEAFRAEAVLMSKLRHPNTLLFMGICVEPDQTSIVTEFMSKGTLHSVLHHREVLLDMPMLHSFIGDIAQGMLFLHSKGVVHRDFKSLNVLVDEQLVCKVSDFGMSELSAAITDTPTSTSTSLTPGTTPMSSADAAGRFNSSMGAFSGADPFASAPGSLYWAAPELLRGEQASAASDVYAFGITCWEIVTRRDPYDGMNPITVASRVLAEGLRPDIPNNISPDLAKLIRSCWAERAGERPSFAQIVRQIQAITAQTSGSQASSRTQAKTTAPTGNVALVFTDVQDSTELWENVPVAMRAALALHNKVMRQQIGQTGGYEVKTEGDAFMIAFSSPVQAAAFCTQTQLALLDVEWPPEVLERPMSGCVKIGGQVVYNGLRVRMGIHVGTPSAQIDTTTRRMDYYGRVVNKAARVTGVALGGQIALSGVAVEAIRPQLDAIGSKTKLTIEDDGEFLLKGITEPERIYSLVIEPLAKRNRAEPTNDVMGSTAAFKSKQYNAGDSGAQGKDWSRFDATRDRVLHMAEEHKWAIPWADLEPGPVIGLGSFGEVMKGKYRGQPVAIKQLLQQRMSESNMLDFLSEMSVLSSPAIRHPGIVLFYGACMDEGHIAIVTEYMEQGNLLQLLGSDKRMSWKERLTIASDVARAMQFLHGAKPRPVLHRDLKTPNILIDRNMRAKIADFGFATIKQAANTMTKVGSAVAMAPELLLGREYNESADVYAFALILWELATRKMPYAGISTMRIATGVPNGLRPAMPAAGDLPDGYADLITSCWDGDATRRPTFQDVAEKLEMMIQKA